MVKMPEFISGFSQVEYLTIFYTILFGVIASEYFVGWGNMFRQRDKVKVYWLHMSWSIFTFLTLIQNWFGIWPRMVYINHNILYFYYGLIPMFLFYLITVVLFPSADSGVKVDYEHHYFKNARAFFILFGIYMGSAITSSLVYEDHGNVLAQNIIRSFGIALSIGAAYYNRNFWLHAGILLIGYLSLFQFLFFIPK